VKKDPPPSRARSGAADSVSMDVWPRRNVDRAAETFFAFQWPNADPPSDELRVFASVSRTTRSSASQRSTP